MESRQEVFTKKPAPQDGPSSQTQSEWFALYTYPRHEISVSQHLEMRSVEVFLPLTQEESRWKDRTVSLQMPVFPGYVFARIPRQQRSRVLSAPGVVRLLTFDGKPASIPSAEIDALKLYLQKQPVAAVRTAFEVGDRVRVRSGSLQGLVGQISRSRNDRRLIVPISVINQAISVEIDVDLLEALEETPRFGTSVGMQAASSQNLGPHAPQNTSSLHRKDQQ